MFAKIKGQFNHVDPTPKSAGPHRGRRVLFVLVAVALLVLIGSALIVIPAGHVGVYDLFGKVAEQSMAPGIHLVNPLATIHRLSVRTQEVKETVDIPTREGLNVNIDVSLLFRLNGARAAEVFRGIGPEYIKVVVLPQLRSIVRNSTSGYDAKALYTAERELLAQTIQTNLFPQLEERGILCETILLRKIILPPKLAGAIESKLEAEQQAEQMKYVLVKEKQEADRKRIEAQGIADYQTIINQGLNDNLLKWKGIEATRDLAKGQNAKVVIIGAGKEGLPLILGNP